MQSRSVPTAPFTILVVYAPAISDALLPVVIAVHDLNEVRRDTYQLPLTLFRSEPSAYSSLNLAIATPKKIAVISKSTCTSFKIPANPRSKYNRSWNPSIAHAVMVTCAMSCMNWGSMKRGHQDPPMADIVNISMVEIDSACSLVVTSTATSKPSPVLASTIVAIRRVRATMSLPRYRSNATCPNIIRIVSCTNPLKNVLAILPPRISALLIGAVTRRLKVPDSCSFSRLTDPAPMVVKNTNITANPGTYCVNGEDLLGVVAVFSVVT